MIRVLAARPAIVLAVALCLAGCEGDQAGTPSAPLPAPPPPAPPPPAPPPEPPGVAGEPAPLILIEGGPPAQVPVSDLFVVGLGQQSEARTEVRSEHETVATVQVVGSGLMAVVVVTPVSEGQTTVTASLTTLAGSATQTIRVTVDPAPVRAVGEPPSATLLAGGSGRDVPVGEYFAVDPSHSDAVEVEAVSEDEGVAVARLTGAGLMSVLTIEPVGPGNTWIRIVVRIPGWSATQWISVTVLAEPPEPPRVIGEPEPLSLVEGGAWLFVRLQRLFSTGDWDRDHAVEVEARSENADVVTVRHEGTGLFADLTVTPVRPGETAVVVTVRNLGGAATARIPATVLPAAPLRVARSFGPLAFVAGTRGTAWGVSDVFEPPGYLLEARSLDEKVVRVSAENGATSRYFYAGVDFDPVGPGETSVVLTASNAAGKAETTVRVTVLEKLRLELLSQLGPAGGPPLRLREGAQWNLLIRALDEGAYASTQRRRVTIRIATDAPADQLRVPESVSAEYGHRLAVPVEALADEVGGEPEATYSVSLAPGGDLPPWIELSEEPIRVTVLDSPGAACEDLRVDASLARTSGTMRRGTFRIQAAHPDTSVSWAAPYVDRTSSHPVWRTVATHVFPERLLLRPLGTGFEQEVRLRWWDGDLRLTVQAPGCEPVELHCDEFNCDVR